MPGASWWMHGHRHSAGGPDPVTFAVTPGGTTGSLASRILDEATLVAYWPLNDASGDAHDEGPSNLPLSDDGTPTYGQPGPFTVLSDTSILFSGVNAFNSLADDQFGSTAAALNIFDANKAFTMECLIAPTSFVSNETMMVSTYSSGFVGIYWAAGGVLAFTRSGTGGTSNCISAVTLPYDVWTHIAATYDGTTMRLYVNGALVASTAGASIGSFAGQEFRLGRQGQAGQTNYYYKGRMAQAAVYSSAVSQATLTAHAQAGINSAVDVSLIRAVTATYTVVSTDQVILANGTFTVTLPAAATVGGRTYTIKNTGTGTVTVSAAGSENIDGAGTPGTISLSTTKQATVLISDGIGWQRVGAYL